MQRTERVIEVPLSDGTLKDLVVQYLDTIGVIRPTEEVIRMRIGEPNGDGMRVVNFMFIEEREVEVIVHR